MDTLPQELLDALLGYLAVYDFPDSARFAVLDDVSRQAILNARLVRRCFRDSRTLTKLFTAVLEETPFLWHGNDIPRLRKVSNSTYAKRMTTLSLCGTNLSPHQQRMVVDPAEHSLPRFQDNGWWTPCDTMTILKQFVRVKHLRYYPLSPKCLQKACTNREARSGACAPAQYGYPPDNDDQWSWLEAQQEPTWVCANTMADVANAEMALESVTFPLFGNRASYCGIHSISVYLPLTLKHLTISLTDRFHDNALFQPWLKGMRNLTFLEVAISRNPDSLGPWNSFASCRRLTNRDAVTSYDHLPRIEEFRLMSDNQNCFSERDLLWGLELFPNLRKLGLAHILIKSQNNNANSWDSFLKRLAPKGLERLWLLDPRHLWTDGYMGQAGHYMMSKYWGDDSFRAAAHEVRLIDTGSLWVQDLEPPKRRDFDYPGFAIFEKSCL